MEAFTLTEYQQDFLSKQRLATCYQNKWFKLFVPKSFDGLQLSMMEGCQRLFDCSTIQGGLGWAVNLGAGANLFSGFFEEKTAQSIFTPNDAVIAGSGYACGIWEKDGDKYRISGEWTKCTGASHATFFSIIAANKQYGERTFIAPREKIRFSTKKWEIFGLKNASSYGIVLNDVSVPEEYAFTINAIKNNFEYGVFHIPFDSFGRLCLSASFLGTVNCLLQMSIKILQKEKALVLANNELKPLVFSTLNELLNCAQQIEETSISKKITLEKEHSIWNKLGTNNVKVFQKVQNLFMNGGLPFVEEDQLLHWAYRDVLTAAQHYMVKPLLQL